jgi:hypothetical protein
MSKKMLIVSTLILTLSSVKTFAGCEILSVSSEQESIYQKYCSILDQEKSGEITSEEAFMHLYELGLTLFKPILDINDENGIPSVPSKESLIHHKFSTIQNIEKLGWITSEEAVMLLYELGRTLPKRAHGVADILDILNDFCATKKVEELMNLHDLKL